MKTLKNNNNGISLVEILVGLAVAGLVSSMIAVVLVNGSRWFNKQSSVVDAQNEAQIINNIITTAILEAKDEIKTSTSVAGGYILISTGRKQLVYKQDTTSLYVYDSGETITLDDGHLLSRWVTSFDVTANSILEADSLLQVDVYYTISNTETDIEQEFSVTPRNSSVSFVVE